MLPGQRYSLHTQSTLLNFYHGLLDILLFLHSKLVLNSFESLFFSKNTYTFIYFYLVLYLQLVACEGAYKILLAGGTACILSRLCPIFMIVCSTVSVSALQICLTLLESLFTKEQLHLFFSFGLVPLAGKILTL